MPDSASAAVAEPATPEPVAEPRSLPGLQPKSTSRRQPRYHVILWNDDDHSYQYVMAMLKQLFGHPHERGFKLAEEVDRTGRAIVLTTTKEHAELKRDQVHAFGADRLVARCKGSMKASIEAEG
ncbi:MAG: ATP-dependent Clp protease adaptor ClpS [Planctomycetia bacterium]|jgi:ATP-dependent Clp protease adaptor protein ClpS